MTEKEIAPEELAAMKARIAATTPGPWTSYVEGRDHYIATASFRLRRKTSTSQRRITRAAEGTSVPTRTSSRMRGRTFLG
jgi:hypothetical protein